MKEIFLIRHGSTLLNEERKYLGTTDAPLSPAGLAQSHLLGERLKDKEIDTIYTSPMLRARKTAEIIASYTKAPVKELSELREVDFGRFEGKTYEEIKSEFRELIDLWLENPYEVKIPEGESPEEIKRRILKIKELILESTEKIAIVGHGGIIKFLIFEILGLKPHFWKISISNGSLTHLAFFSSIPSIIVMNDTSHFERNNFVLDKETFSSFVLPGGVRKEEKIEIRRDPLLGYTSRLCHYPLPAQKPPVLEEKFADTKEACPFCPENTSFETPRFDESISNQKVLKREEATLFPNISPYDKVSALCVITERHFVDITGFTVKQLFSAFTLAADFLLNFPSFYPLVAWNFLPPSGGSIVHPHIQAIASETPGNFYELLVRESRKHLARNFVPFWEKWLEEEMEREDRLVFRGRRTVVLSAYAPRGGAGEWILIFPHKFTLKELGDEDWKEFVNVLQRLFAYFKSRGLWSFNLGFFFSRGIEDGLFAQVRIIPRYQINPRTEAPDSTFYTYVYAEPVVQVVPEEEVKIARQFFS